MRVGEIDSGNFFLNFNKHYCEEKIIVEKLDLGRQGIKIGVNHTPNLEEMNLETRS
jgi:hypothetical protein